MNILISNDDGVFARGIQTLSNTLAIAGHTVTVVCPDRERSATGHGLTMHKPIRAEPIDSIFHASVKAWACSGTPADCVKLALGALVDEFPDLVISGINHGANLGTDILYSGTVSAAMEGVIEGIPAIATSLTSYSGQDFDPAAQIVRRIVSQIQQTPLPLPLLFNVNVPAIPASSIRGIRLTRQGIRRYFDQFEKRVDPRGKTYYWLAGEVLQDVDIEDPLTAQIWPEPVYQHIKALPTDVQAIREGYVSITPLQYNLTALADIMVVKDWMANPEDFCKGFDTN